MPQVQIFFARTVRSRALEVATSNQWRQESDCRVGRKTLASKSQRREKGPHKDSAGVLKGPGNVPLSPLL